MSTPVHIQWIFSIFVLKCHNSERDVHRPDWSKHRAGGRHHACSFPCAYSQQSSAMARFKLIFSLYFIKKQRACIIRVLFRNAGGVQLLLRAWICRLIRAWTRDGSLARCPLLVTGDLRCSCCLWGYHFPSNAPGEPISSSVNENKLSCPIFSGSLFLSFSLSFSFTHSCSSLSGSRAGMLDILPVGKRAKITFD